ncbi:8-oxo-dGTP diphosphatase [Salinicoccus sp. ID82-1]|uniref:8-oxo-dGTP diphosphatase n=1 Tax=Salinicoccus cyprini TaxID=2493691 RepID=A0A558AV15_9STAP|nr:MULTISPECIES: 8-oxo-dGTP diphosphatase [Salinicoccus]MCG1010530.1 8-oxo-dGTP diphosphatase [Salinicoccus sp. ID82-1]TVT28101.1 8-oxo-dGTP diphosphatase [Salinicoccus cyprini]
MSRAEMAILTNMCMIQNEKGQILIQDRLKHNWPGVTFPGGHIEKGESFHDSVIREVFEETGLTIRNPKLCGVKQFQTANEERYIVFFYRAKEFEGELASSAEGEVSWIEPEDLANYTLANDFEDMYRVFADDSISEFFYDADWKVALM